MKRENCIVIHVYISIQFANPHLKSAEYNDKKEQRKTGSEQ
jgi:hypothetical protein